MSQPTITPGVPALVLAPMDGVTDAPMRALQGEIGSFTYAVTEFLRISHSVPHKGVFFHHVPELHNGGLTPTGLPVQVQLLGGHPGRLAEAALVACSAGATSIDLNFGCPAPTVNRHDGGATLLKHPARLREIVRTVREAVPADIPVSAKMRLGWDCVNSVFENAEMATEGGASWLTIHARTRSQGYAPPVDWPMVGRVRERVSIPVIANGDIQSIEGFRQCREETGCEHFMIGRGALARPQLSHEIATELGLAQPMMNDDIGWPTRMKKLMAWNQTFTDRWQTRTVNRMKQWLRLADLFGDFTLFDAVKRATSVDELLAILEGTQPPVIPEADVNNQPKSSRQTTPGECPKCVAIC
ncbi:tRNA dihydrouridine synthase [Zavarzinella formosa]|uniref:tRNA dihydrouridine synthase n=1 Tax=Zavarzinella formosa TaxID=360055 RepID=UPI0002FFAD52|nr:tRNA-dihydrouridine synthase family protein [Zavarzinella formosa]